MNQDICSSTEETKARKLWLENIGRVIYEPCNNIVDSLRKEEAPFDSQLWGRFNVSVSDTSVERAYSLSTQMLQSYRFYHGLGTKIRILTRGNKLWLV